MKVRYEYFYPSLLLLTLAAVGGYILLYEWGLLIPAFLLLLLLRRQQKNEEYRSFFTLYVPMGSVALLFTYFLTLSIVYYRERLLWADWAFESLRIFIDGFVQAHARYTMYVTELLPLFGLKLKLPLNAVLTLYSVGFLTIPVILTGILSLTVKNKYLVLLPLLPYLLSREIFYSLTDNIVSLSISAAALGLSITALERDKWKKYILLMGAILLLYISIYHAHPISAFMALMIAMLFLFMPGAHTREKVAFGVMIFLLIFMKYFVFLNEYEKSRAGSLADMLNRLLRIKESRMLDYILHFYRDNHPLTLIISGIYLLYLTITGERRAIWMVGSLLAGLATATVYLSVFAWAGEGPAAMEFYALILPVMVVSFLVGMTSIFHKKTLQMALPVFLMILLVENGYRVWEAHKTLDLSLGYTRRIVESCLREGERKAIVHSHSLHPDIGWYVWTAWSWDAASLLYSMSVHGRDSAVTFAFWHDTGFLDSLARASNHEYMLGPFWWWLSTPFKDLDTFYFRIPSSPYRVITSSQDSTVYQALERNAIHLEPADSVYHIYRRSGYSSGYTIAEVDITHTFPGRIPSIPNETYTAGVSYELYDEKGKKVPQGYQMSNFERDLPGSYRQGVFVWRPRRRGKYQIQFGFLSRKHGFIPSGRRAWLLVE